MNILINKMYNFYQKSDNFIKATIKEIYNINQVIS